MLTRSERPTAFPSARSGRVGDGVEISVATHPLTPRFTPSRDVSSGVIEFNE
jgi:hypothetical protein